MATVINQRVNYGSADESIPASARTRNIHADGFPSRVRQVTGNEGAAGNERTAGRGNTREERHDQKRWMDEGDAAEGVVCAEGGRGGGRDSARHRHPGAGD